MPGKNQTDKTESQTLRECDPRPKGYFDEYWVRMESTEQGIFEVAYDYNDVKIGTPAEAAKKFPAKKG